MAIQGVSNLLLTSLAQTQRSSTLFAEQLATGNRLVRPSIDPSAFVASERVLSELSGLGAVTSSIQRGRSLLSLADAGLSDVSDQLNDIRRLTIQSFNAVGSDRDAIQGAINNTIGQIDRNLSTTRFAGQPLSAAAFRSTNDSAGVIDGFDLERSPNPVGSGIDIDVEIRSAGSQAQTTISAAAASAAGGDVEFELRGASGQVDIRVAQGATEADFAAAINSQSERTGIEAVVNGADVELRSVAAGSNQVIELSDLNASGIAGAGTFRGSDADVSVNGVQAQAQGNSVRFDANGLVGSFDIDTSTAANTSTSLQVVGGGITLPIDGSGRTATFGFSAFSGDLGRSSGVGTLSSLRTGGGLDRGSLGDRLSVLDAARDEVISNRVRLGVAEGGLARAQSFTESLSGELAKASADLRGADFASTAVNFQQANFQRQLQVSLIRQSNLSQAGVLRLLSPLS
ncbi:MAG: flagellin [Planctomycetes bacterium]|nr:flagellin [Planctomycetota bacterium]